MEPRTLRAFILAILLLLGWGIYRLPRPRARRAVVTAPPAPLYEPTAGEPVRPVPLPGGRLSPAVKRVRPAPPLGGRLPPAAAPNRPIDRLPEVPRGESPATDLASGALTVRVVGLRPEGPVRLALFERPDEFPNKQKADRTLTAVPQGRAAELRIEDLPAGEFAIAVFQDLNEDGVLNKGAFGIPSEPYGFSNNARGAFGPPSFRAAAFDHSANNESTVEINVKD